MNTQGVAAVDYYSLINKSNTLNSSTVSSPDFKNILDSTKLKTEVPNTSMSARQILQETYPDLKYHVLDASQFTYWNRNDFPASKLFEDNIDIDTLKSWKPTTPTATGYEPWVQHDLEKIQKGLHVVFIHPATQAKMEKDPEYAKQIADKIEKYFENDIRINEAIDKDSVKSMSQAVTITEDGEIGLHATVCDGPSKTAADSEESGVKKEKPKTLNQSDNLPLTYSMRHITNAPVDYDYRYIYADIKIRK